MNIQLLPQDVVNLIAAGEVIDSIGAVIRELVENALDAGATRIVISLTPDLWRLQVADNGMGMTLEDLKLCSQAHTTSKIRSQDDLWKIATLGFRGEALHSIAQVAQLTIASRVASAESAGWRITYNQRGETEKIETVAIAPGTIVTVSHLFSNLPVRRKGLPPMGQQLKTLQNMLQQIALCHPQITWHIEQNGHTWFKISPSQSSRQIFPQILKSIHETDLQEFILEIHTPEDAAGKIQVIIGLPDRCHRRRPDWVKIAINGRMVKNIELEQSILNAFSRILPRDRFPICFLHLQTCPSQIDWNRHPAKTEIYLHNLTFWQEKIKESIEKAMEIRGDNLSDKFHNQRVERLIKVSEKKTIYQTGVKPINNLGIVELKAVGQVHNTYIVAEHSSGVWLIEQHIAHERIIYEQLVEKWEITVLDTPIILQKLTTAQREQLERLLLEIEPFGEEMWAIRSAPSALANREYCADALLELSRGGDLQTAQVATACRTAIRNGTSLTLEEMQTILEQWKNTKNPRTCPHGRPIFLPLEETSLARFFRRNWVIGKSHGI